MKNKIRIGITTGLRGPFAVMYNREGPIQTGISCKTLREARIDAIEWAKAEFGKFWKNHCDISKVR